MYITYIKYINLCNGYFHHSIICFFSKYFIEELLHARHCPRHWETVMNQQDKVPDLVEQAKGQKYEIAIHSILLQSKIREGESDRKRGEGHFHLELEG